MITTAFPHSRSYSIMCMHAARRLHVRSPQHVSRGAQRHQWIIQVPAVLQVFCCLTLALTEACEVRWEQQRAILRQCDHDGRGPGADSTQALAVSPGAGLPLARDGGWHIHLSEFRGSGGQIAAAGIVCRATAQARSRAAETASSSVAQCSRPPPLSPPPAAPEELVHSGFSQVNMHRPPW